MVTEIDEEKQVRARRASPREQVKRPYTVRDQVPERILIDTYYNLTPFNQYFSQDREGVISSTLAIVSIYISFSSTSVLSLNPFHGRDIIFLINKCNRTRSEECLCSRKERMKKPQAGLDDASQIQGRTTKVWET